MHATIPRRVIGYCRVSSVEQARDGTSLDGQREEIARWCRARGYPDPSLRVETESGSAERAEKRAEQLTLVREAEPGDLIVVVAVDRWSRDIVHAVQSVRALVARGVRWFSIREALDACTTHGDSMLGMLGWVADEERKRIRTRTVGRRRELADAGHYVAGSIPLGYRRNKTMRKLEIVQEEADVVLRIFRECVAGRSLPDIAADLPHIRKRITWNKDAVFQVLHCRYLLGEQRRGDGTWQPDAHPAVVTRELWDRAHAASRERVYGGRKFSQGQSAQRLLRGLARCSGCGYRVSVRFGSGHRKDHPEGQWIHYYACRNVLTHKCGEGWQRAQGVDASAEMQILARLAELRDVLARPSAAPTKRVAPAVDYAAELPKIERARARIIDSYASGDITREDMRRSLARQDERIEKVKREIGRAKAEQEAAVRASDPARRADMLRHVDAIDTAWSNMPVHQRQQVIRLLAVRVEVGRGVVRFVWRTDAELAAEAEISGIT